MFVIKIFNTQISGTRRDVFLQRCKKLLRPESAFDANFFAQKIEMLLILLVHAKRNRFVYPCNQEGLFLQNG